VTKLSWLAEREEEKEKLKPVAFLGVYVNKSNWFGSV
jgi:hypothetical protein